MKEDKNKEPEQKAAIDEKKNYGGHGAIEPKEDKQVGQKQLKSN